MRLDNHAAARVLWMSAAFVVFGIGFGLVWWPSSQAISQVREHARELYEEANDNDAIARRAPELEAAQSRIRADLARLGGIRTQGETTAATLRLLSDESKRFGVEVRSVSPGTAARAPEQMTGTDLSFGMRGRFRNLVSFIADVPRRDILLDVHDAQITSNDPTQSAPMLEVTLHATMYRVTLSERAEGYVPSTR